MRRRPSSTCLGFARRLWRERQGASAVEFAVLLPLFVPLIFAVVQVGQLFWTQTALQHAVDIAARCATINTAACGSPSQTQTFAATQAYGLTFPAGTFTASTVACGNQVSAAYTFPLLVTAWFPATVNLSARSCYPL